MPWFDRAPAQLLMLGYGVLCAIGGVALWRLRRSSSQGWEAWRCDVLVTWLVMPVVLVFIVSVVNSIFVFRYFIVTLGALILLAAMGASEIRSRAVFAAAMTVMILLMARSTFVYHRDFANEDWSGATQYVPSAARERRRITVLRALRANAV
jgi:hypothetical protein